VAGSHFARNGGGPGPTRMTPKQATGNQRGKVKPGWDIASGQTVAGRFGWEQPLEAQCCTSRHGRLLPGVDMGLTSSLKTTNRLHPKRLNCERLGPMAANRK